MSGLTPEEFGLGDLMTPNHDGTPEWYTVDADNVPQLVERIKAAAAEQARAEGIRLAAYEGGLWCGECDPADQDDDCCVLAEPIRAALATGATPKEES
jgi:hypothetical protein